MSSESVQPAALVAGLVSLRLRGRDYWYAVLYADPPAEEDPAYRHGDDHPLYVDQAALVADLGQNGIPIDEEPAGSVDVDRARAVVGYRMSREEIAAVITAWNALDDITKSLGVPLGFSGRLANRCYDKLFWGLNLESVTPPGEWYVPAWRPRELAKIDQVLRECGTRITPSQGPN
ncbi:MAG: hypothetical protein KDB60_05590 [Propionibacteriaceae bacterium]|nr:hypothetical protein [Propionibacteriaceae bacterium]